MRLLVIFLLIPVYFTYAKKGKKFKGVKDLDSSLVDDRIATAGSTDDRYRVVPFGHIFRDGFDPKRKDPVDFLELDSVYMKDSDLTQQLIKSGSKDILPIIKEKPKGFASPKDEVYFGEADKEENIQDKDSKDKDERFWHDFVGYQRRNINITPDMNKMPKLKDLVISRRMYDAKSPPPPSSIISNESKQKYFDRTSFNLQGTTKEKNNPKIVNWTTCEEFRRKSDFHPKDVVNIDWVPFYVWSVNEERTVSNVHRFSYPTKKLVKEYKDTYSPYINRTIDWDQPKLLLKESMQMLLIAVDRRGLFNAIPYIDMPKYVPANAVISTFQIRMKIVGPYLAYMICDYTYAIIMAVSGTEPKEIDAILAAAATLKFKGTGTIVQRDLEREKEAAEMERKYKLRRNQFKGQYVPQK